MRQEKTKQKVKMLEYELGRYKVAVEARDKVIAQLREDLGGQYEVAQIISAYMSLLIEDVGGTVRLSKEEIANRIGKYGLNCEPTETEYVISVKDRGAE